MNKLLVFILLVTLTILGCSNSSQKEDQRGQNDQPKPVAIDDQQAQEKDTPKPPVPYSPKIIVTDPTKPPVTNPDTSGLA